MRIDEFGRVLGEREGLTNVLLTTLASLVVVLDREGRILLFNGACEGLTGYAASEVLGTEVWDLLLVEDDAPSVKAVFGELAGGDFPNTHENEWVCKDGSRRMIAWSNTALVNAAGEVEYVLGTGMDITERKLMERLLEARLSLTEFASTHPVHELLRKTLDEICALAESPIGFYHFVEPDERTLSLQAWSTRTVTEFCTAEGAGRHYPIEEAGVWADCIRERRPLVHEDVASLPHLKGVPTGHAVITRELVVPILRAGKIVAILGVGNKGTPYTPGDVELVNTAADFAYELAVHRRSEAALAEAKTFTEVALDSQRDTFFVFDPATDRAVHWNRAFREVSGYSDDEIARMKAPLSYYSPDDLDKAGAALDQIASTGSARVEMSLLCKDGRTVPTEYYASIIEGVEPDTNYVVAVGRDITERWQTEQALRENVEKLRSLSDNIPGGTVYQVELGKDGSRVFNYLSAGVEAIHGITPEEGMRDASLLYSQVLEEDIGLLAEREQEAMTSMSQMQAEFRIRRPDGEIRWILVTSSPRRIGEGNLVWDGFELDITRMKLLEEEVRELSVRDPLTGLYNRRGFFLLGEQAMRRADRDGSLLGIVFLDVNGLKHVNDTLGHQAGDRLLGLAADAMRSTFRHADIMGRVGGDEFAVCAGVSGKEELAVLIGRLQDCVSAFRGVLPGGFTLSMSWGTAVYGPSCPSSLDALLAEADRRMYENRRGKTDF